MKIWIIIQPENQIGDLKKIIELEVAIEEMVHDDGVGKFIPTPKPIANKNATINMKNENDEECLKWCVTRALFPTKIHPERVIDELREQAKTLNWKGVKFPAEMRDIAIFKKNNNVSIHVFRFN